MFSLSNASRRTPARLSALLMALVMVACGGDGGTQPSDSISSVSVTPSTATLTSFGATTQLSASASSAAGAVSGATFTWSSSDPSVATVDATGLVTAVANGSATITALAAGTTVTGTAAITVAQAAATITVTPAVGMVVSGETLQLTASVQDAGGSNLTTPNLAWSSSDPAVATVDATGLVSGLAAGAVVITASQDNASGTSALDVIRGDFTPTTDATLGGTVQVAAVTIPLGVTVTLTDDLTLDAEGPVAIAGNVTGDCLGLSVSGQSTVTISGTFSNACSTVTAGSEPPVLEILGADVITLDGSTITSSGDILISNQDPRPAAVGTGFAQSARFPEYKISMVGGIIRHSPETAPGGSPGKDGLPGTDGQDGHDIVLKAAAEFLFGNTTIQAQHGGPGVDVTVEADEPDGVALPLSGGHGGAIAILPFNSADLGPTTPALTISGPPSEVTMGTGDGGAGGSSTLNGMANPVGEFAPGGTATGGNAGNGGLFIVGDVFVDAPDPLFVSLGAGGVGGDGTANGSSGHPGNDKVGAQWGGDATATGGDGGDSGSFASPDRIPLVAPPGWDANAIPGGVGGRGFSFPGNGGGGVDLLGGGTFGAGNDGGTGRAFGGRGGNSWGMPGAAGGDVFVGDGNGGAGGPNCPVLLNFNYDGTITVVRDIAMSNGFMLNVPPGGQPILVSGVFLGEGGGAGTNGGAGGGLFGTPGLGGHDILDPGSLGPPGVLTIGPGGNGGASGPGLSGFPGGLGGAPGRLDFTAPPGAMVVPPLFEPGVANTLCFETLPSAPLDPLSSALLAVVQSVDPGTYTLSSTTSGFVTVSGPIAADGTITATGRGTVAGFPNIAVGFSGTLDEATGKLVGEYSMDTEATISPGHPVVYGLDLTFVPPAPSGAGGS